MKLYQAIYRRPFPDGRDELVAYGHLATAQGAFARAGTGNPPVAERRMSPGQTGTSNPDAAVALEPSVEAHRRALREDIGPFLAAASFASLAVIPVIYSLIVPLALLDLWVTLYQRICFPVYGIAQVKRSKHLVLDRQKLAYLNAVEAFNCRYCSYANGVISYAREIAGLTEEYWCPIKHASAIQDPHERYPTFVEYDDAAGYRARIRQSRERKHLTS